MKLGTCLPGRLEAISQKVVDLKALSEPTIAYCGQLSKEESGLLSEAFTGPSGLIYIREAGAVLYDIFYAD